MPSFCGSLLLLISANTLAQQPVQLLVNSLADQGRIAGLAAGVCWTGNMVNNDQGQPVQECTLRAAIQTVNNLGSTGQSTIGFVSWIPRNSGNPSASMFFPQSSLPSITRPVLIDGLTHPDFDSSLIPRVIIRGDDQASGSGLILAPGSGGSILRGLAIYAMPSHGVVIQSPDNQVVGCHIGINASGNSARANGGHGVLISSGGNRVGHAPVLFGLNIRNVISGNAEDGVRIMAGNNNIVSGNRIGTNRTGTAVVPNQGIGIYIGTGVGTGTRIGDFQTQGIGLPTIVAGNQVAGNLGREIRIDGAGTLMQCTDVGVNADRSAVLDGANVGVQVLGSQVTVGNPNCRNHIALSNFRQGIVVGDPSLSLNPSQVTIRDNRIGMNAEGAPIGVEMNGVSLTRGSGHLVTNNSVGNSAMAIAVSNDVNKVTIRGNRIGIDQNHAAHPVMLGLFTGGADTVIGGSGSQDGNVIGFTAIGIATGMQSTGAQIQGNYLGLTANGVDIHGVEGITAISINGQSHQVGSASQGNLAFGFPDGVEIQAGDGHQIVGNLLGLSASGLAQPDSLGAGVIVRNAGGFLQIQDNRVGNFLFGIVVEPEVDGGLVAGNRIGFDSDQQPHPVSLGIYSMASGVTIGGPTVLGNQIGYADYAGILVSHGSGNTVLGNHVGLLPDGAVLAPDTDTNIGLFIMSDGNSVGGLANVIGGHRTGIQVSGDDNEIVGNWIGRSPEGHNGAVSTGILVTNQGNQLTGNVVGNAQYGIRLNSQSQGNDLRANRIGVTPDGAAIGIELVGLLDDGSANSYGVDNDVSLHNVIGNSQDGIVMAGTQSAALGNFVGVMPNGQPIPLSRFGIYATGSALSLVIGGNDADSWSHVCHAAADGIRILGTLSVIRRVRVGIGPQGQVCANGGDGVRYAQTSSQSDVVTAAQVAHNAGHGFNLAESGGARVRLASAETWGNAGKGVHLGPGGRDQDPGDADDGPNRLQNFPEIDPAQSSYDPVGHALQIRFRVDSAPGSVLYPLSVSIFLADDSSNAQGIRFLGVVDYAQGDAQQWVTRSLALPPDVVVGTLTRFVAMASSSGDNLSSELSGPFGIDVQLVDEIFRSRFEPAPDPPGFSFSQQLAPTFQHPRCVTCHAVAATDFRRVSDDPPGVLPASHPVVNAGTNCSSCHSSSLLPPTGSIDPGWQSAPAAFDFRGLSDAALCKLARQPVSGHTPLEHMTQDRLVLWAVGDGRVPFGNPSLPTAPPNDIEQWRLLIQQWSAAGMPCD